MNIVFVTGSADFFEEAVASHVRLLAETLVKEGHAVAHIALNHVSNNNLPEGTPLPFGEQLALSSGAPWSERGARVTEFLRRRRPDWVSFHFVPYSFSPRGLFPGMTSALAEGFRGFRLHMMMHELWVGMHEGAPLKQQLLRPFQRHRVLQCLRELNPELVTTSIETYRQILRVHGVEATLLPMFGNIGLRDRMPGANFRDLLLNCSGRSVERLEEAYVCGLFGGVLPQYWPGPRVWKHLARSIERLGKRPLLVSFGRSGLTDAAWQRLTAELSNEWETFQIGQLEQYKP